MPLTARRLGRRETLLARIARSSSRERKGRRLDDTGCIVFRIVGDKVTDLDECVEDIDKSNEFWAD